jgi:methionyl-tRNA formyltransferase
VRNGVRGAPVTKTMLLMGSKPGAVVALEVALRLGWRVLGVVVSKENPHPWLPGPTLDKVADGLGIPVFVQASIPPDMRADLVVSYMYRNRVKPTTLAMAKIAALNFHAAPLPEFGGWAFYSTAILEKATEYGCSCHHMDDGFDTGDLCVVRRFPIDASRETAVSLERRAQREMIELYVDVLRHAARGDPLPHQPQERSRMRYLDRETFMGMKQIPSNADAETIDRTARAFFYPPYEGAHLMHNGHRVEVLPDLAKHGLGPLLHTDDYNFLAQAARLAENGNRS